VRVPGCGRRLEWLELCSAVLPGDDLHQIEVEVAEGACSDRVAVRPVAFELMVRYISAVGDEPLFQKTWNTYRCHDAVSAGTAIIKAVLGAVFQPSETNLPTLVPLARAKKLTVYHWPVTHAGVLTPVCVSPFELVVLMPQEIRCAFPPFMPGTMRSCEGSVAEALL
jgi:hypothetical protein